jgi:hypothetical protein
MTLGTFLDAAYTSLVEEYRRLGADLQTSLAEMEMWRAGGPSGTSPQTVERQTPQQVEARGEKAQALENEKALAQLQQMMAGVNLG